MSNIVNTIVELIIALVIGLVVGWLATSAYKNNEQKVALSEQQAKFDVAVQTARDAKDLAEKHSLDVEQATTKKIADIETQHQNDLGIANEKRDKAIADLRAGTNRLRVTTDSNTACSSAVPGVAGNTSISSNQTTAYLPAVVAERLIERASLADEIALQANSCADMLLQEREAFNSLIQR